MDKFVILREATPSLLTDMMNIYFEKGYQFRQVFIDDPPLKLYCCVMELS